MMTSSLTRIFDTSAHIPLRIHAYAPNGDGQTKVVFSPDRIAAMEQLCEGISVLRLDTGRNITVVMDLFDLDRAIYSLHDPKKSLRDGNVLDLSAATERDTVRAALDARAEKDIAPPVENARTVCFMSFTYNQNGSPKAGLRSFYSDQISYIQPDDNIKDFSFIYFRTGDDFYVHMSIEEIEARYKNALDAGIDIVDLTKPEEWKDPRRAAPVNIQGTQMGSIPQFRKRP